MVKKTAFPFLIVTLMSIVLPVILNAVDLVQAGGAQVHFEKRKLKLGNQILEIEIADNQERSARGLMYRTVLAEGKGMLFVFPDEQIRSFWMKNTFIPLAIGYFNAKKELIDVQEMAATQSEMQKDYPTYVSKEPAKFALEVPSGWFTKHKIVLKQKFKLL